MNTTAIDEAARVTTPAAWITADELPAYEHSHGRVELVRGRLLVREPAGMRHGECALRIGAAINTYLSDDREKRDASATRGRVVVGETGFTLARNPDTVRGPDVAYVSRERFPGPFPDSYGEFAPDLAVEIRSPSDRIGAVLAKVGDWLEAGTLLVWVVYPARQLVTVYRADGSHAILGVDAELRGDDLLPGFTVSLAALFTA